MKLFGYIQPLFWWYVKILTGGAFYAVWITCEVRNACADTSVVLCCTVCISSTLAWVYTFFWQTSQCCWTILINKALIWITSNIGISFSLWYACADGMMGLDTANGIGSTGGIKQAGILAWSLDTCLRERTFIVMVTASWSLEGKVLESSFVVPALKTFDFTYVLCRNCMGLPHIQRDRSRQPNDWIQNNLHLRHRWGLSKDLDTVPRCKPGDLDIQDWWCIQVWQLVQWVKNN